MSRSISATPSITVTPSPTGYLPYSYTIWYDSLCYYDGFYIEGAAPTIGAACNLNTNSIVLYSNAPTFVNGITLYYDQGGNLPFYGNIGGCGNYYRIGSNYFVYNTGVVSGIGACASPTPTPTATPSITRTPSVTPTVTPSITRTPSVTPTVTPSTSVQNVNITLYHRQLTSAATEGYIVWYSVGNCNFWQQWTLTDCDTTTTCTQDQTISFPSNTTVYMYVEACTIGGVQFGAADNKSTCPTVYNYCDDGSCLGVPFSFNTGTSAKNIAVTVYTSKFGYTACI